MRSKTMVRGLHVGRVVLCTPISGTCVILCRIWIFLPEVDIGFLFWDSCLFQAPHFRANDSGFGRPMQLFKDENDNFRALALYVRDGLSAYRKRSYECACCEVIVVRISSSSHNFFLCSLCTGTPIYRIKILTVCWWLWLRYSPFTEWRLFFCWRCESLWWWETWIFFYDDYARQGCTWLCTLIGE